MLPERWMILVKRIGIKRHTVGVTRVGGRALLLCLALSVGACGFRLEGAGSLPGTMTRTFVDSPTRNSAFVSSLRDALRQRGSELVDSAAQADSVLVISSDDTGQRVLSVSARNIPREYEIYYAVTVSLRSGTTSLMEPETIIVTRAYTYDETQVLGKSAEEDLLREALARDLARQVLRRIESAASGIAVPIG
jgi:LPS-assembly lipoprotein